MKLYLCIVGGVLFAVVLQFSLSWFQKGIQSNIWDCIETASQEMKNDEDNFEFIWNCISPYEGQKSDIVADWNQFFDDLLSPSWLEKEKKEFEVWDVVRKGISNLNGQVEVLKDKINQHNEFFDHHINQFVHNLRQEVPFFNSANVPSPPPPPLTSQQAKSLHLPPHIYMKTLQESITHEYYAAVRNGKVYYKRHYDTQKKEAVLDEWKLLMGDGMPRPPSTPTNNMDRAEFALKVRQVCWLFIVGVV
jgi:hypothetical protein